MMSVLHTFAFAQAPGLTTSLSSPRVTSFEEDSRGFIWIGTRNGLNRFNGFSYTVYRAGSSSIDADGILDVMEDSDGNLWLGTECGIRVIKDGIQDKSKWSEAVSNPVSRIIEADDSTIVATGRRGLARFRKSDLQYMGRLFTDGLSHISLIDKANDGNIWLSFVSNDSTFVMSIDHNLSVRSKDYLGKGVKVNRISALTDGSVVLATDTGLRRFLGGESIAVPQAMDAFTKGKNVHFVVNFRDGLIVGIAGEGIFFFKDGEITRVIHEENLLAKEYIIFVDSKYNIWLSDGINRFQVYTPHKGSESIQVSQEKESISSLCFDKDGFLWMNCGGFLRCINPSDGSTVYSGDKKIAGIRTDAEGGILFVAYEHELTAYSVSSSHLTKIWSIESDASISSLAKDKNGAIWFTTDRGLFRTRDGRNTERIEDVENLNILNYIESDQATGRLFMGTISRGVYELFPEGGFYHFQHIDITDDSIRDQANIRENDIANISCQWVDKDGSVWFGTFNHGLLHAVGKDNEPELYGEAEGLPQMNIRSIIGDNNGNIWFSTTTLIYKFNKEDKVFSAFHDRHFTDGSYDIGSVAIGPDGKMYFGGNGYITVIDPDLEVEDEEDIPLYLEYIGVNGEALSTDISDITLTHRQKTIALRFASPVYVPGKIQGYSWKLEGFDKDWQFGPSGTEALYSYIPAGHYTFKGRVRQQNGEWSSKELSIPVTIKPSFWGSIPARIAYVLITLLLAYGIIQLLSRIKTQKERLILSERREEMKQEQVDFVTNISHEFRTPLSMIVAPAKELSKIDVPDNAKALVNAIVRNADRLNTLSTQILDSNSPEKKEHLEIRYGDIAATVKAMVENFRFASLEKGLSLSISAPESLKGWYDREKIGKIITNLISNAIKYTPSGKSIDVIVRDDSGKVTVSVSDDGIGIPEEKRARLFERYDRLGAEETSIPGSGIGLSYANSLAVLHKGELSYQPKSPEGSVFSISIPTDKASYKGEMIVESAEEEENVPEMLTPESDNMKDGTILIAEDSEEIRTFLRTLLSENYRVVTAADGLEAMDNMKLGIPDLVISDIMMPSMNGYELCRTIKENPDWSHVPVILLTAKADATSSIEGLKSGADAYIPKPFDPDYLKAVVESIIRNRRILQDKILNLTSTSVKEEPSLSDEIQISPKDKALLEKIHTIMEENIATEQFGAEEMAAALKMSYSNLYAKMKALTGKTPLFFINNYRMNKAKELLSSKLYTVSEVAYKIGSLSPNTFSRDFKKHFGVTPSSLMKD